MLLAKTTTLYFLFQVLVNARPPDKTSSDPFHPCDSRVTTVEFSHHFLSPCRWNNNSVSPEDTVILDRELALPPAVGNKLRVQITIMCPPTVDHLVYLRQDGVTGSPVFDLHCIHGGALKCLHHADDLTRQWYLTWSFR